MTTSDPGPPGNEAATDRAADGLLAVFSNRKLAGLPTVNPAPGDRDRLDAPLAHHPGDTLGSYTLVEHLADGGMGEVWIAERSEPFQLKVALKIIKAGMDTREVVARFEAERKALALMEHPHIARVFDGGATELGRPYFVMELVEGLPVTAYCDQARLSTRERLALFIKVCEAVQHAHQRGIIHRDLKPGNILVATHDGQPFPKVIDFGIAKATNQELTVRTLFTEFGRIVGTLAYMSPEQAAFHNDDVDTRADIYSLGCLLYELLTGVPPFDEAQLRHMPFDRVCQAIRETGPAKPSTRIGTLDEKKLATLAAHQQSGPRRLRRTVRGDLDRIVQKALQKDRQLRYQTASEFGKDVGRFLIGEPVDAQSPDTLYKITKFARRHTGGLLAAAAVTCALVAGTVVSWVQAKRALLAEQAAVHSAAAKGRQASKAQRVLGLVQQMFSSANPQHDAVHKPDVTVRELLDEFSKGSLWQELSGEPEIEAALRETIGEAYLGLHEWDQAEFHLDSALRLRRRHLGAEHRDSLRVAARLATVYYRQHLDWGRDTLSMAESLLRSTLQAQRRAFGQADSDTLRTWSDSLALSRSHPNRTDRLPTARRIHEAQRNLLGESHPDTLATVASIAELQFDDASFLDAIETLQSLQDIQARTLATDHPSVLATKGKIGSCLHRLGRYGEAVTQFQEIVHLQALSLGSRHPDTLTTYNGLLQASREWARELASPVAALYHLAGLPMGSEDWPWSADLATAIAPLNGQVLLHTGSRWMVHHGGATHYEHWKLGEVVGNADWIEATAPLGFGDGGVESVPERLGQITYRFVCAFRAGPVPPSSVLLLNMLRDDGVVLFLNGQELLRENVPPGPLEETTPALYTITGLGESTRHSLALPARLVKPDALNYLAAEVRQTHETSTDLRFDLELRLIPLTPHSTWPEDTKTGVLAELDWLAKRSSASQWSSRLSSALRSEDSSDAALTSNPDYWLNRSYLDRFTGDTALALQSLEYGLQCFPADQPSASPPLLRTLLRRKVKLLDHLARPEDRREAAASVAQLESRHRQCLDLEAYYNAFPHEPSSWHGKPGLALRGVADSVRSGLGQAYQVGGILQLNSGVYPANPDIQRFLQNEDINSLFSQDFPDRVRGLPLDRSVINFYLLGACVWDLATPGEPVAYLVAHYADATEAHLPLRAGQHLAEWASRSLLPEAEIAWSTEDGHAIYEVMLQNPHPEKTISTIDLVSAKTTSAPFFLAITLE